MSLLAEIKVVPSSGRQKCIIDKNKQLKCYLKNAPDKGKANIELIKFLSKTLKLPQEKIVIISGATSRKKRVNIETNLSFQEICDKLCEIIDGKE